MPLDRAYADMSNEAQQCGSLFKNMEDLEHCIGHIVESDVPLDSEGPIEGAVVVLWATDNDELTNGLLERIQTLGGVQVIRVLHQRDERNEEQPWESLMDLALLEQADVLIATTGSKLSFAAHARGLMHAYYPSLRRATFLACGKPVGTEGGLLTLGPMFDDCDEISSTHIKCATHRDDCLTVSAEALYLGNCLQEFGMCLNKDTSWASQYLVDIDLKAQNLDYIACRSMLFEFGSSNIIPNSGHSMSENF
jgi:hypothetical protein